jgi:hypothetical protein
MPVASASQELIASVYRNFNAREIDAVLSQLSPDVDWPNGMEGTRELGRDAVRVYWLNQWAVVDPHVEPVAIYDQPDGRTLVDVHQVVRDLTGALLQDVMVKHVYTIRDGLMQHMEIRDAEGNRVN